MLYLLRASAWRCIESHALTKCCGSIADEDARPEDYSGVIHDLGGLQHHKGQKKEGKAAGSYIIQSGDGVQFQSPPLQ